mgnify:CR=1 FL=1
MKDQQRPDAGRIVRDEMRDGRASSAPGPISASGGNFGGTSGGTLDLRRVLSTIHGLARWTRNEFDTVDCYVKTFNARLRAISSAYETAQRHSGTQFDLAEMAEVIRRLFITSGGDKIQLQGPRLMLPATIALPMGLVLHEWMECSRSRGVLTMDDAKITLHWAVEPPALRMQWAERTTTSVLPEPKACHVCLVKGLAEFDLAGQFTADCEPHHHWCNLDLQADFIQPDARG